MDVDITSLPELRVAAVRHVGPYSQIPQAFEKLGSLAGPAGLIQPDRATMVGIYYDDPATVPQEKLRADAGIVVPEDAHLPQGLEEERIPGGRYARTTHVGPYEQLGDAWARFLGEWLPASGHRIRAGAASFEIYGNTPMDTVPAGLITELYIPIE